jgi:hypothetical protein
VDLPSQRYLGDLNPFRMSVLHVAVGTLPSAVESAVFENYTFLTQRIVERRISVYATPMGKIFRGFSKIEKPSTDADAARVRALAA